MTTQELHISLDILLQKINSSTNKNFLPQEKDFFLNREIRKFIRQRMSPLSNDKKLPFSNTIKRIEDLDNLLETVSLDIYKINKREGIFYLPFNFLHYISSEVQIRPTCKVDNVPLLSRTYSVISFNPPARDAAIDVDYSVSVTIGTHTTVLYQKSMLPLEYIPQDNIENYKKFFIRDNAILSLMKKNAPAGVEVKWNTEINKYEIRAKEPITLILQLQGNSIDYVNSTKLVEIYNIDSTLISEVRIIDEEFKTPLKASVLSKSKDSSLVGELKKDLVTITLPKNVVHLKALLTYYREPRTIDLLLGLDSDLPDKLLEEIVSNTAETMKAVLSSDTYEKFAKDNLLIE